MYSKVQLLKKKKKQRISYQLNDIPRKLEYKNFKHKNDRMLTC